MGGSREKFKNVEFAIASLPFDLQRIVTADAMRASLEVRDYAGAAKRSSELDVVGVPADMKPEVAVLRGRLAEALGQDKDALDDYRFAVASSDRQAAAGGKQLEIGLKQRRGEISQADALRDLETLSAIWRGDAIEVKTLQMLSHIYSDTGHFRESLAAARTATRLEPNSEISRQVQDEASALFSQIYLSPKGDDLPPVDALGMFYEFRELTPIGRRGDEMIRRLADRLVAVDLLDQAAELLQYQVDHRLEGAARAQVAAKLAMVYSSTASRTAPSQPSTPRASPTSPANCASSGYCWRRGRRAMSDATILRSTSSRTSTGVRRSACVPTSTGRRGAGARPPSRSSFTMASAGATSSR